MIILMCDKVKRIDQDIYDEIVNRLNRQAIQCNNCHQYGFYVHSYYEKTIKTRNGILKILIQRLICPVCKKTHALLFSCMIPYCQILLEDGIKIVMCKSAKEERQVLDENPSLSIEDIIRIKKKYRKHWKQRLLSFHIGFDDDLTDQCIKYHLKQFLQIRCGLIIQHTVDHVW